jgi:GNAT superfamily N-acetyltransferase
MRAIFEYHPSFLPELTIIVNSQIAAIQPCWMLTPAQIQWVIENGYQSWGNHYHNETDAPHGRALTLCALEDEKHDIAVVAAAQCLYPDRNDTDWPICSLSWVVALPGYDEALDKLLNAIMQVAWQCGCEQIVTSRFGFSVGWMGIPTAWPHLIAGLDRAGYDVWDKWLLMVGDKDSSFISEASDLRERFRLDWQINEAADEWNLNAFNSDNSFVGECQAWGIPPQFRGCAGFDEWITVEYLGVEWAYQRQGIGRALLAEQMRYQSRRGIKHVLVWTETDNAAARRVNEILGFRYDSECWRFRLVHNPA